MDRSSISHAIFVGDVHLSDRNPARETAFCRFLDHVCSIRPDRVFLMGDIFEFWFGYRYVMFSRVMKPVTKITQLVDSGIQITYLVGNHDFKPGHVFTGVLKVDVSMQPVRIPLGDEQVYISHGDEINIADRLYRLTRAVFRNRTAQFLFQHAIPASWAWHIGMYLSDSSRRYTGKREKTIPSEVFDAFCRSETSRGTTVILHGHNHDPGERVWENGAEKLRIIDTGDWLGDCGHYVEYRDGLFECKTWPF